jgi:hypothetical protein
MMAPRIAPFLVLLALSLAASDCQTDCCRTLSDRPPMTYTFYQDTGRFVGGEGNAAIQTRGYSGHDEGFLNPDKQCAPGDIGPLPASTYKLGYCKNVMHEVTPRPCSFYLDPMLPDELCGRKDFFVHGCQCCGPSDDSEPPTLGCSSGCIVISYDNRRKLRLGDRVIVEHRDPQRAPFISILEQQ